MSYLDVQNLEVSFERQKILDDVSFAVDAHERLCLLGPSGCGKTTSLRVIAGFTIPDRGSVQVERRPIDAEPPERRNIGILFQSYALFPHLNVYDNVAFGLRMRGMAAAIIRKKVGDALSLVRLTTAAAKKPSQLSGGEQQRIAFARAIVIEPRLLLLDEPFSNLDARLRQEMRGQLMDLLQQLKIPTVMVTHDQEEAMAIADRIAVMNKGRIEQIGSPSEIYETPKSAFVARFVGESNLFSGMARRAGKDTAVEIDGIGCLGIAGSADGPVDIMIRPEKISVERTTAKVAGRSGDLRLNGRLERVQYLGHRTEYGVRVGNQLLAAWSLNETPQVINVGSDVSVRFARAGVVVFPRERAA